MSPDQSTTIEANEKIDCSHEVFIERDKKPVRCRCPKCGITHILRIFWTGTATPRKYCHKCREIISSVNEQYIYEMAPDAFRIHRGVTVQPIDS